MPTPCHAIAACDSFMRTEKKLSHFAICEVVNSYAFCILHNFSKTRSSKIKAFFLACQMHYCSVAAAMQRRTNRVNSKGWYCDLCYQQWYKSKTGKIVYFKPEYCKAALKTCKRCKRSFEKSWEAK